MVSNVPPKILNLLLCLSSGYRQRKEEINVFNEANRWKKRGLGVSTMLFPVDYYGLFSAFVAIYNGDGTVSITHGGIECGQGMNTKVSQIAAYSLGIPVEYIRVKPSNNVVGANAFVSGATVSSESVCNATKYCCDALNERLKPFRESVGPNASWLDVVRAAHQALVDLTEKATFGPKEAKSYPVYGCTCAEVEVDILTGNLQILRVDIVEDVGRSMSPFVDVGQIEGAFIMGLGYWLHEKIIYHENTLELLTNRTWNYKTPGAKDIPIDFRVKFVEVEEREEVGILRSKATGEPALCMAIAVPFALRNALISSKRENRRRKSWINIGILASE